MKYAFLMSIPTIIGALEIRRSGVSLVAGLGVPGAFLGIAIAALTAACLLRIAVRLLRHRPDRVFALYNAALGLLSVIVYVAGKR